MKLTKEECLTALDNIKRGYHFTLPNGMNTYEQGIMVLTQLIENHFDSHKLSYNELDFIIECVKPYEKELGLDVEMLLTKLDRMKYEVEEEMKVEVIEW